MADETKPGDRASDIPDWAESMPVIDGFSFVRPIGRGGMGIVWEAIQQATQRRVAVKLLAGDRLHGDSAARFRREIELASQLEHPGIARVYDSGLRQGRPFYCMEFIEGLPFHRYCATTKLPLRDRVDLIRRIAEAVQCAHQRGVIHRDLKPGNVLVDAAGQPHVLDFGLAKLIGDNDRQDDPLSVDGEIMGTPIFMSPEQAAGRLSDIDTRTDVYSLGVMLYDQATGLYPHDVSGSNYDILKRVIENDPVPPRRRDRSIDPELECIILKALARNRDERYSSAGALAEDLGRYLAGEPLHARPASTLYIVGRRLRKHRTAATLSSLALLVLAAGTAAFLVSLRRSERAAVAARDAAERSRQETRQALSQSIAMEAERLVGDGETGRALAYLAHALRTDPSNDTAFNRTISLLTERNFPLPLGRIPDSDPAPATATITTTGSLVTVTWPGTDAPAARLTLPADVHPAQVVVRDHQRRAIVVDVLGVARVYDLDTGRQVGAPTQPVGTASRGAASASLYASPDDRSLWQVDLEANLTAVWNLQTGAAETSFVKHRGTVYGLAFRPDGRWMASYSRDQTIRIWDTWTGLPAAEPIEFGESVNHATFSPDGRRLRAYGYVWELGPGAACPRVLQEGGGRARSITFSPDGSLVAASFSGGWARMWKTDTGKPACPRLQHDQDVVAAEFDPAGRYLLTASADGTARLWSVTNDARLVHVLKHTSPLRFATFSPDGSLVLTLSRGNEAPRAQVWETATGTMLRQFEGDPGQGAWSRAAFSPDGKLVSLTGFTTGCSVWDVATGVRRFIIADRLAWSSQFTKDGSKLLVALSLGGSGMTSDYDGAYLYDMATGRREDIALFHLSGVVWAEFSDDETRIATASIDGTACIWDVATGTALIEPIRHGARVDRVHFSRDGRRVITASRDSTSRIWDAATGRPISEPHAHNGWIVDAKFSPDGRFAVTAGNDGRVVIRDCPAVSDGPAPLLADLAEVIGGYVVSSQGIAGVDYESEARLAQLKAQADAVKGDDPFGVWLRWFFSPRTTRSISPFSPVSYEEYVDSLVSRGSLDAALEATSISPNHPAALRRLARIVRALDPARAAFFDSVAAAHDKPGEPAVDAIPVIDAHDIAALKAQEGNVVTVEGILVDIGMNRSGTIQYLDFDAQTGAALTLTFFVSDRPDEFTEQSLSQYVGKRVRVTGPISSYRNHPQIRVESLSQIELP